MKASVQFSNIARPLSYKIKTTILSRPRQVRPRPRPLFQDQDRFFEDHQIINSRPQKTFPYRKNQASDASYAGFAQSCWNYAGNRKKNSAYYRLSSQVLLHPKLGFKDLKFGFVQN